jgi:serine/threonine protein kinase
MLYCSLIFFLNSRFLHWIPNIVIKGKAYTLMKKAKLDEKLNKLFANHYEVINPISSGAFGSVYKGKNIINQTYVAIKIDKKYDASTKKYSSIIEEASILTKMQGIEGIPTLYWSGVDQDCIVLVQELLGRDLSYYMRACHRFSIKTVSYLARHLINILMNIHKNGYIHRDLKPENILLGLDEKSNLPYIVDFGIAKPYKDKTGSILPINKNKNFVGTQKFASIAAHEGIEVARKDDLESLLYIFIYLAKGKLPWQFINRNLAERVKAIGESKKTILVEELCKNLPESFFKYYLYLKKLTYFDEPDYEYLINLFKISDDENFNKFEWINKHPRFREKEKENFKKEIKSANLDLSLEKPISTILEENVENVQKMIDYIPQDPNLLYLPSSLLAKSSGTLTNISSNVDLNRISNIEEKIFGDDYVAREFDELEDNLEKKIKNLAIFLIQP